uniref:Uncharacterized protein n=1 Tax=Solanum tuberosum TaxID=4113 RepID=M1B8G5_SOLTU
MYNDQTQNLKSRPKAIAKSSNVQPNSAMSFSLSLPYPPYSSSCMRLSHFLFRNGTKLDKKGCLSLMVKGFFGGLNFEIGHFSSEFPPKKSCPIFLLFKPPIYSLLKKERIGKNKGKGWKNCWQF